MKKQFQKLMALAVGSMRVKKFSNGTQPAKKAILPVNGVQKSTFHHSQERTTRLLSTLYRAVAYALDDLKIGRNDVAFDGNQVTPHAIAISLLVQNPAVARRIKALRQAIEVRSNWPHMVNLERQGAVIHIRFSLPTDAQKTMRLADLSDPFAVGVVSTSGKPVRVNLNNRTRYALKIFGLPGSGKTTLLKAILYQMLRNPSALTVVICDPKGDLSPFAQASSVKWYAKTQQEIEQVISAWCAEIMARKDAGNQDIPELLLVVDEADESLQSTQLRDQIASTLQIGRAFGARLLYINHFHKPKDKSHKALTDLISFWINGKSASASQGSMLAGQAGSQAHKLAGTGTFEIGIGDRGVQFSAVYITDDEILALPQHHTRPTLPEVVIDSQPQPETQPKNMGRPRVQPTAADVALALEYHALYGKSLSARVAKQKFGITRTRWNLLPDDVERYHKIESFRGRIRAALVKKMGV